MCSVCFTVWLLGGGGISVGASQLRTPPSTQPTIPLCRFAPQTSCDPSGGTYERWVHGRGLGDTATDQAGRAGEEAQGGHFQLYQPGHVTAGERRRGSVGLVRSGF